MLGDLTVTDCMSLLIPSAAYKSTNQADPEVFGIVAFLAYHVIMRHTFLLTYAHFALSSKPGPFLISCAL